MKKRSISSRPSYRLGVMLLGLTAMYAFIFYMSSQNGQASGESSGRITALLEPLLGDGIGSLEYFVRKCAHMAEFALLYLMWYRVLGEGFPGMEERGLLSAALLPVLLSAAADEFHQIFVPGRSAQVTDVIIDMGGACMMLLCVALIRYVQSQRNAPIQPQGS